MLTKKISLIEDITRLLSIELSTGGLVTRKRECITVAISREDFEQHFGIIVLKRHRAVEEYCPDRNEDVFIFIRDTSGVHENRIKVWRSI